MNGGALMLTSNLGKTNSQTSKYWTPLSCDSPFTWIFHTPCVKKKHSTCYIISSFKHVVPIVVNQCSLHSRRLGEIYLSFPAHCCSTFTNLEFTSSGTFHSGISEIYVTKNHKSNPAQKCCFLCVFVSQTDGPVSRATRGHARHVH